MKPCWSKYNDTVKYSQNTEKNDSVYYFNLKIGM